MSYSKTKIIKKGNHVNTSFGSKIIGLWILGVSTIFPLIIHDAYFDILPTKFGTYSAITGFMILSMWIWMGMSGEIDTIFQDIKKSGFRIWFLREYNIADRCLLIFYGIACISTIAAYPYIWPAFLGHYGRYTGLLLLSLYTISYFLVTRYYEFKKLYYTTFLIVGDIICLFGIIDYFGLDIMGYKEKMNPEEITLFTSTIGNINTYTTYVGFVVAFAGAMFVLTKVDFTKPWFVWQMKKNSKSFIKNSMEETTESIGRLLFYFISMLIGFIALTMGQSDNGYLTLLAFFGCLPFMAFKTKFGIRRYILILAVYFSIIKGISWINILYADRVAGIDGIYEVLLDFKYFEYSIVLLWIITIGIYFLYFKNQKNNTEASKIKENQKIEELSPIYTRIWTGIVIIAFLGLVGLVWYANTIGYEKIGILGGFSKYLVFQDSWGTFRGYIWRVTIEEYLKYPWFNKIFGTGPDTFGLYMIPRRGNEMLRITTFRYDSAHNEYLQYLATIGPIALVAYIIMLIYIIRQGFGTTGCMICKLFKGEKGSCNIIAKEENTSYLQASAFLILCYAVQAIVNINLPISTPVMWMFMMMIVGMKRKNREKL